MKRVISRDTTGEILGKYMNDNYLSSKVVAKAIGCSNLTIQRIITDKTCPTDEMIKQSSMLMLLGYKKYKKMTTAEKEKISETIGVIGCGGLGLATVSSVISVLGFGGLSAAGITSGLAALGAVAGGGMVAGLTVAAAIPITTGAAGYALVKGIKSAVKEYNAGRLGIDEKWEVMKVVEGDLG